MPIHFEELWEKCEKLHQDINQQESVSTLIDQLMMKLNLYKVIAAKTELASEEIEKIKSRTMGEILLTLTNLSLQENIDVFDALSSAYKYRSISYFSNKY